MNLVLYRRITQISFIFLIFLLPVFDILRYDSASRELLVFGHAWSLGLRQGFFTDQSIEGSAHIALQFFLKAVLPWVFVLSIFPLLGYFAGRFFCGWLCPEGALFEYADYLTLKLLGRRSIYGKKRNDPEVGKGNRFLYGTIAVVSAIVIPLAGGIALTGYFVAPRTIWGQLTSLNLTFGVRAGIIGVSLYMLTTSILVRHALCRFVCAAGLMQMLFGWVSPISLRLQLDSSGMSRCTDCKGCDRACFMGVVPRRNKRDISCVNCGACIDACRLELGRDKGLFSYSFGEAASRGKEALDAASDSPFQELPAAKNRGHNAAV